MTDPAYVLARATPKGARYEAYIAGGIAQFTSAEVGHALAGYRRKDGSFERLPEGSYRILLIRYADGNEHDLKMLIKELFDDCGRQMDWVTRAAHTTVCRAAVGEFLSARRCLKCEGRQMLRNGELLEVCNVCDGTGYRPASSAERANNIGIPRTTFRNGPAERLYMDRLKRCFEWEAIGLRRVAGKTRR